MNSQRVASIDIFRGLTMLLMIFVNDLASVGGLPWWNYHMPHGRNGMTYVDMVFPAFLFIVGLSLPLAINARLTKDHSEWRLWTHILARTAGLLVLGIGLANAEKCTSMPSGLWGFLMLLSGILFWLTNPRFRYLGLAGLIVLFAVFRRAGGHWLDFSYWEILGLIGWTYLAGCVLYVPTRRWKVAPMVWLVAACLYNALRLPKHDYAGFVSLVFAGVVCSQIVVIEVKPVWVAGGYAAILGAGGLVLMPLGISKLAATPSWCLFTACLATVIFAALYQICDVRGKSRWATWVRPAGANTILTYLLPDLYYFGVAVPWMPAGWSNGLPGLIRAVVFTGAILGLAAVLTKWRIRMQL